MKDDSYKDSTLIMQLLRDNLTVHKHIDTTSISISISISSFGRLIKMTMKKHSSHLKMENRLAQSPPGRHDNKQFHELSFFFSCLVSSLFMCLLSLCHLFSLAWPLHGVFVIVL